MTGVVEAASPSTRALATDGRLGLMLTELRLPTIKRLVARCVPSPTARAGPATGCWRRYWSTR